MTLVKFTLVAAVIFASLTAQAEVDCESLSLSEKVEKGCKAEVTFKLGTFESEKTCETMSVKEKIETECNLDEKFFLGKTALMKAVQAGNKDDVKLLLRKGADINIKDDSGVTALMMAVSEGKSVIFDILMAANAKVTPKDNRGNTALSLARLGEEVEMEILIMSKIANLNFCKYDLEQINNYFFITADMAEGSTDSNLQSLLAELQKLKSEENYNQLCNIDDSEDSGSSEGAN